MTVDVSRWPAAVWRFQEVIAAAVESFASRGRTFDYRRSAIQQLRERILELRLPDAPRLKDHRIEGRYSRYDLPKVQSDLLAWQRVLP
jgi:hypothetical protein